MKCSYDELPPEVLRRTRSLQARLLRQHCPVQLLRPAPATTTVLPERFRGGSKYLHLAGLVMTSYLRQIPTSALLAIGEEGVEVGYYTVGRLVEYSPPAYQNYVVAQCETPSTAALRDILLDSQETAVRPFAPMHSDDNRTFETFFGIRQKEPDLDPPFLIDRYPVTDRPVYMTNPELWLRAANEVDANRARGEITPAPVPNFRRCPAIGPAMTVAWESVVHAAAADPAYFATDLGLATQRSPLATPGVQ